MASYGPPPRDAATATAAAATTAAARAAATHGVAVIHGSANTLRRKITPVQAVIFWRRLPVLQQQQFSSPL